MNIGYEFKNAMLLKEALTHTSYTHESKNKKVKHNEKLEFLGDAILELVISEYIYKTYPELSEGELTKFRASIVCEASLAKVARKLDLGSNLTVGRGEEVTGGRNRDSILADAFEAVLGAIYIDSSDIKVVAEITINNMKDVIKSKRNSFTRTDYKTTLQEMVQKASKTSVQYAVIKEEGPSHNKVFTVTVAHGDKVLGCGTGKSKKAAEQSAAKQAIKTLKSEKINKK